MKSNREIRREAFALVRSRWFWRIFSGALSVYFIAFAATAAIGKAFGDMSIQTWSDFLEAKVRAFQSGLGYAVPSSALAWQMTGATLFQNFIACIFGAIVLFGMAALLLKAVRNAECNWFSSAFGGFKRPLEVAWLMVLMNFRVFLWSLLFVVPGIVAVYRYRQAWYLKSDHPDWTAAKCIAESGRMMRGMKWRAFALDCSYLLWLLLGWMIFAGAAAFGIAGASGNQLVSALSALVSLVGLYAFAFSIIYMLTGRTVFYRELSSAQPAISKSVGRVAATRR